jgi:hypothetical protein
MRNNQTLSVIENSSSERNKEIMPKLILHNDLSILTNLEKCNYIHLLCQSMGLNVMTQPFKLLKLPNKGKYVEQLYMTKDGTEQLRKVHGVSIVKLERELIGDIYMVTAYAEMTNGKKDASTGAVAIKGLNGDALANAYMKAETKSKRRATLSICGLGMLDESEIDTIKDAQIIDFNYAKSKQLDAPINDKPLDKTALQKALTDIENATNMDDLQYIFSQAYKYYRNAANSAAMNLLVSAKDDKKRELEGLTVETLVDSLITEVTPEQTEVSHEVV